MSNTYFQCKQFTIRQERCAMKACTDACLFGAWTARVVGSLESEVLSRQSCAGVPHFSVRTILDIGSGTGLLALMLAQKINAMIDTIEIDADAYWQATQNVTASLWNDRIRVIHADVKNYRLITRYDLIISNPPFFETHLRSPVSVINIARHDEGLKWEDLIEIVGRNLQPFGLFSILLPFARSAYFTTLAGLAGLHLHSALYVKQTPQHPFFRSMLLFGKQSCLEIKREELVIKEVGRYSQGFISLLKDYYLYM